MDGVLVDLERIKYTISRVKSQFYIFRFRVVGFIYDTLERHPNTSKIIKIVEWPSPNDVAEVKAFVEVTIYYRVFIKNFAIIATPIYFLMRKKVRFIWDTE